jgi:hypothetical protein
MPLFESIQVDKVVWNGDNKLCIRLKRVIGYLFLRYVQVCYLLFNWINKSYQCAQVN